MERPNMRSMLPKVESVANYQPTNNSYFAIDGNRIRGKNS